MKKISFVALAAWAGVFSSGCGRSSDGGTGFNPQPAPGTCPAGYFWTGVGCAPGGSSGGSYISNDYCSIVSVQSDGSNGTRTEKSCPVGNLSFPRLTGATDIYSAWWGPMVMAGDVATFRVHDSFFGLVNGGFKYSDETLCLGGWRNGTNHFMGAVASSYFAMPRDIPQQMPSNGRLYLGINDSRNYSCVQTSGLEVRLIQCRTPTGTSYPCN